MTEPWVGPSGLPTSHVAQAALHVASIIDPGGSHRSEATESYWHHATGGSFPPDDLKRGEALLISCGLVVERAGVLYPSEVLESLLEGSVDDALAVLADKALQASQPTWLENATAADPPAELRALVPDADRREELLIGLARTYDDTRRRLLGAAGEELVVTAAREELFELGHHELARAVRRVSLLSDQLGYDVSAPRVNGPRRLLEVKATASQEPAVTIHLSRNEAETAQKLADWSLVVCVIDDVDSVVGRIAGWCDLRAFGNRLPTDGADSRWEQAVFPLHIAALSPGLPRAVA